MKDTIIKLFNLEPRNNEQIDICPEKRCLFLLPSENNCSVILIVDVALNTSMTTGDAL